MIDDENETAENEVAENEALESEAAEDETVDNETADNETAKDETADYEPTEYKAAVNEIIDNEIIRNETAVNKSAENEPSRNIERLLDVEMSVIVRFGTKNVPLRDVVRFGVGAMIELDRTVDEPVEVLVNGFPYARGEVVVIDGYYGVRITEIGTTEERSQSLIFAHQ